MFLDLQSKHAKNEREHQTEHNIYLAILRFSDLFGMVSSRDPKSKVAVTSNDPGLEGHGLNHLLKGCRHIA